METCSAAGQATRVLIKSYAINIIRKSPENEGYYDLGCTM